MDPTTIPYTIGASVTCDDGARGTLTRVILDPVAQELTHLVVELEQQPGSARLVPVGLIDRADATRIALHCDADSFARLESATEVHFVPARNDELGYPADQLGILPYYRLGPGLSSGLGAVPIGPMGGMGLADSRQPHEVAYDRVPLGQIEVQRGERVHARDGDIGKVQGLVVDPRDNHVTHVLLQEGHLWGKKEVAIPIGAVTGTADGIELGLSKDEVRDLPPVAVEHPDWLAN